MDSTTWQTLADAYAFLGNSLLRPMTQTSDAGLGAAFWEAFPDFGDEGVALVAAALAQWAQSRSDEMCEATVTAVSVEYTALFVGPPSPAAPPWETMCRREGATVGFGEPTFQMRGILRDLGLKAAGPSNQYEDHMGIELLCLSEMCRRRARALDLAAIACEVATCAAATREAATRKVKAYGTTACEAATRKVKAYGTTACEAETGADGGAATREIETDVVGGAANREIEAGVGADTPTRELSDQEVCAFIVDHPLGWIESLEAKVEAVRPDGYFAHLLALAKALLACHRQQLV